MQRIIHFVFFLCAMLYLFINGYELIRRLQPVEVTTVENIHEYHKKWYKKNIVIVESPFVMDGEQYAGGKARFYVNIIYGGDKSPDNEASFFCESDNMSQKPVRVKEKSPIIPDTRGQIARFHSQYITIPWELKGKLCMIQWESIYSVVYKDPITIRPSTEWFYVN